MRNTRKAAWKPTSEAAQILGFSTRHLQNLRNDGVLKLGKHYRDIRRKGSRRPRWQWHTTNIEKLLETPAYSRG